MHNERYRTLIHERVAQARRGANPTVICRVRSGWVVLGDDQRLKGYTLLLADPIRDNLNELALEDRQQFLIDMSVIGDALVEVLNPSIINYSILGNTDRALHAHIHPRYDDEEPDMRRDHPIRYHWLKKPSVEFDLARDGQLMELIYTAIARRTEAIRVAGNEA